MSFYKQLQASQSNQQLRNPQYLPIQHKEYILSMLQSPLGRPFLRVLLNYGHRKITISTLSLQRTQLSLGLQEISHTFLTQFLGTILSLKTHFNLTQEGLRELQLMGITGLKRCVSKISWLQQDTTNTHKGLSLCHRVNRLQGTPQHEYGAKNRSLSYLDHSIGSFYQGKGLHIEPKPHNVEHMDSQIKNYEHGRSRLWNELLQSQQLALLHG